MEIKGNGREFPLMTLPKTSKQLKTLAILMEIKGNGEMVGDAPRCPTTNNQNH
jgi:hypothetical protein